MVDVGLIAATLVCILVCAALMREPRIALQVRPTILISRGMIRAEVRIPRDAGNRALTLVWASDNGSRGSSYWQIDGEDAPVIYERELPDALPGNYHFLATLVCAGRDGQHVVVCADATADVHDPAINGGDGR